MNFILYFTLIAILNSKFIFSNNQYHKLNNDNDEYSIYNEPLYGIILITCKNESEQKKSLDKLNEINFNHGRLPPNISIFDITNRYNLTSESLMFQCTESFIKKQHFQNLSITSLEFQGPFNYSEDFLDDLKLTNLTFYETSWLSIPIFFSKNSKNLKSLEISENHLTELFKNNFEKVQKLEKLDLNSNSIKQIEQGTFDDLISLRNLDISNNKLKTLPPDIFKNLINLEILNLKANEFDNLRDDLFINNHKLTNLSFTNNEGKLSTLPDGFFKNLSHLQNLYLSSNNFSSIPKLFDNQYMKLLDLSNNKLCTIPKNFLKGVKLNELDLSNNQLTELTSTGEMGYLRTLKVSRNRLMYIDESFCRTNTGLKNLDLSFNNIGMPRNYSFDLVHCYGVSSIDLSHNNITEIPDWNFFVATRTLDLQYNNIEEINIGSFFNFSHRNQETIDLKGNPLTTIDFRNINAEDIKDHPSFNKTIRLGNNLLNCNCNLTDFIDYLHENGWKKELKKFIVFEASGIECAMPVNLKAVLINDIRKDQLGCETKCNEICTCFDYPSEKLLSMDCSGKNLTRITNLLLSTNFPNPFDRNIKLNLSGNNFRETFPMNESFLRNVTHLDLSNNRITKVSRDVFSKNLKELKLHNNSIERLDYKIVEYLTSNDLAKSITLNNNKWICDCEAQKFVKLVRDHEEQFGIRNEITCDRSGQRLYTIPDQELCGNNRVTIIVVCLVISIMASITGCLAALYYKYQKSIKIWLYSKRYCLWFVTEDEIDRDKEYDAFISFSHKDEDFVVKEIVEKLENCPESYKLCLHFRDWLAGEWIPTQISHSVTESRRTVIVLSKNFLESVWGIIEFRTAHNQALSENRPRLIIILYGDIGNVDNLDPELKTYLKMNTYIEWGDPWFWNKLKYALPHKHEPYKSRRCNIHLTKNDLNRLKIKLTGEEEDGNVVINNIHS